MLFCIGAWQLCCVVLCCRCCSTPVWLQQLPCNCWPLQWWSLYLHDPMMFLTHIHCNPFHLTGQTFLSMLCSMRFGVFFFFGGCLLLGVLFAAFFIPETRNVPIEEMEEIRFGQHWFWGKLVAGGCVRCALYFCCWPVLPACAGWWVMLCIASSLRTLLCKLYMCCVLMQLHVSQLDLYIAKTYQTVIVS